MNHEDYMHRCFELAEKGLGSVSPNPMVGSVIVAGDKIIGEGYHEKYGASHAEVNAINSVKHKDLIKGSTLYVNLEPCSHHGQTPPCCDLLIEKGIRKVVISNTDTNPLVGGKGIEKLRVHGIEVIVDVLAHEGYELNRRFFTFHEKHRPYVILKWAQTADGFISRYPVPDKERNWISGRESKKLTHTWRAEEQAIMIGTNTALNDDPELTTRLVEGENPIRIVIDKNLAIPATAKIFRDDSRVLVFTQEQSKISGHIEYVHIQFSGNDVPVILEKLYQRNILSVIVEGGSILLNSFIGSGQWDETRVFVAPSTFGNGIKAPAFGLEGKKFIEVGEDRLLVERNFNH
jgi:diaminohydroxyphosphoribosylaminopyrimidine deaminase/5-amino-6-(5-phosphoribosylamino)uracil reductase